VVGGDCNSAAGVVTIEALSEHASGAISTVVLGRAQSQFQTVFLINQIASTLCNSDSLLSLVPKIFKLCMGLDLNVMNNFDHWLSFQFPLYLLI
jgi:hypothetical protein